MLTGTDLSHQDMPWESVKSILIISSAWGCFGVAQINQELWEECITVRGRGWMCQSSRESLLDVTLSQTTVNWALWLLQRTKIFTAWSSQEPVKGSMTAKCQIPDWMFSQTILSVSHVEAQVPRRLDVSRFLLNSCQASISRNRRVTENVFQEEELIIA